MTLACVAAVSALAACSAAPSTPPTANSSRQSGTTDARAATTTPPTTIPGTPHSEPVVLAKEAGEKAAIGCGEAADSPCDVEFAISNIHQGIRCEDPYPPLGSEEQLVRFDIEIWTAPAFVHPDIGTVFFLDQWGIGDAEGVDNDLKSQTVIKCEGEVIGDQIQKTLMPGTHVTKTVVVSAPRGATMLRLYSSPIGDGWTWKIPPP